MGLLDDVIGAALGTISSQPAQGQYSQIASVLAKLLAQNAGARPTGQASPSGGLDELINQFRQNGLGDVINSWIGTGENQPVSPGQLRQALGRETVNDLSQQAGVPHDDLLAQLSKILPGVIDRLTPNGQLPNQADLLPGPRSH